MCHHSCIWPLVIRTLSQVIMNKGNDLHVLHGSSNLAEHLSYGCLFPVQKPYKRKRSRKKMWDWVVLPSCNITDWWNRINPCSGCLWRERGREDGRDMVSWCVDKVPNTSSEVWIVWRVVVVLLVCWGNGEWLFVLCLESGQRWFVWGVENEWREVVAEWRLEVEVGEWRETVVCLESREWSFVWRSVSEWRVGFWM